MSERNARKLLDGSSAPANDEIVTLTLGTHCPTKWLAVDLETGDVWRGGEDGRWYREKKLIVATAPRGKTEEEP